MNKVSIVIPTHNRCVLLEKAIKSVLEQDFIEFQLIIIDDASEDNTENFVKSLNDNRIEYYKIEKSKGGNYARNLGISKCNGRYIAFLDDDDEWCSTKLRKQVELFEKDSSVGLVYTGSEIIYVSEDIKYFNIPNLKGELSKKILIKNYIGTTSSVIIRKDILNKTDCFDENLSALQDYDLWIRICQLCNVEVVKEPLVKYYNRRNVGQISENIEKYSAAIKWINKKYETEIKKLTSIERTEREFENLLLLANKAIRNNNSRLGRRYLIQGFRVKIKPKSIALFFLSFFSYKWILKLKSR